MKFDISRIVVTGDVLRQRPSGGASQTENILWLFHQVYSAIGLVSDLAVSPLVSSDESSCLSRRVYACNSLPGTFASWVSIYGKTPTAREQAVIWDELHGALVVSFELPELMRSALERVGIPYLDFTIHPARFLDDLALGVRSNIPDLLPKLSEHILFEEEIQLAASQAQSTLSKIGRLPLFPVGEDAALFAGQTTDDKVLIRDGHFLSAEEFLDDFARICRKHARVVVKPHPYAPVNPVVSALSRLFPNVWLTDANFYHLLSHSTLSHVYSLTSSTSIEAKYFGKAGVHLAPYPYVFSDSSMSPSNYLAIHPDIHLPAFWKHVLEAVDVQPKAYRPVRLTHARSRLRHTLRSYWGAAIFEQAA